MVWMRLAIAALALVMAPLSVSAGSANPSDGSGTLVGPERLNVPKCGHETDPLSVDVTLSNGTWSGNGLSGTAVPLNEQRRHFDLAFSPGSLATFEDRLEDWASELCGLPVTITSSETKRFKLKFNKTLEQARVLLNLKAEGFTEEGVGKGIYKLKITGHWVVAD